MSTAVFARPETDTAQLKRLEAIVERGLASEQAYWDGIRAMRDIRESGCYEKSYGTWAEYCQRRWKISRQAVDKKIQGLQVVENFEKFGNDGCQTPPTVNAALRADREERAARQYEAAGARIEREAEAAGWKKYDDTEPQGVDEETYATMSNFFDKATFTQLAAEFVRLIPAHILRQAYLEASKLFHPDKGGDAEKMKQLTSIWKRLNDPEHKYLSA